MIPAPGAKLEIIDPLDNAEDMIIEALNIGRMLMREKKAESEAVLHFVEKYGLMGFMTGLPMTADFMDYEKVYFPFNEFLKTESMDVFEYLNMFFPFRKPTLRRRGTAIMYEEEEDIEQQALIMVFSHEPMAKYLVIRRDYAEPYDWIVKQLISWAFVFITSFLYYEDFESLDETQSDMMQKSMRAFSQVAPTYHVELLDRQTIVWDFHSLMAVIQGMIAFIITDEDSELRICKECGKIYLKLNKDEGYCEECKCEGNSITRF